jgi:hypothetical protein
MLRQFAPCKIRSPGQETLGFFQFAAYSRENPHLLRGASRAFPGGYRLGLSWLSCVCKQSVKSLFNDFVKARAFAENLGISARFTL